MRVLVLGAGYTGHRLAVDLTVSGHEVLATSRDPGASSPSYPLEAFELHHPDRLSAVLEDHAWTDRSFGVVFTAGPPLRDSVDGSLRLFEDFLDVLPVSRITSFVYLSSTSVYGDTGGSWVDESGSLNPVSRSGTLKVRCEETLADRLGSRVPVLRVRPGGIYGPGRNGPDRYLDPDYRLVGGGEKWTNRIHVLDLVRILARTVEARASGVLNAVDGRPVRLRQLVEFLYRETGRDPEAIRSISWEEAEARYSEVRLGLLKPQKRVAARRLRESCEFRFRYPNVFEGMRPLLGP